MKTGSIIFLLTLLLVMTVVFYPRAYFAGWKRGFAQSRTKSISLYGKNTTNNFSDVTQLKVFLPNERHLTISLDNILSDETIYIKLHSSSSSTNLLELRRWKTQDGGILIGVVPQEHKTGELK